MKENHYCHFDKSRIELSAENVDGKITDIMITIVNVEKNLSKKQKIY